MGSKNKRADAAVYALGYFGLGGAAAGLVIMFGATAWIVQAGFSLLMSVAMFVGFARGTFGTISAPAEPRPPRN
jgi:hypothetical protein